MDDKPTINPSDLDLSTKPESLSDDDSHQSSCNHPHHPSFFQPYNPIPNYIRSLPIPSPIGPDLSDVCNGNRFFMFRSNPELDDRDGDETNNEDIDVIKMYAVSNPSCSSSAHSEPRSPPNNWSSLASAVAPIATTSTDSVGCSPPLYWPNGADENQTSASDLSKEPRIEFLEDQRLSERYNKLEQESVDGNDDDEGA